jgi:uncharacterized protein YdeI (YjbR/CyaY-like superfamily)
MRYRPIGQVKSLRSDRSANRASNETKASTASTDKTVIIPEDLAEQLRANPEAAAFFDSLAYSHRKEYVRWITDAKREETRNARVAKTIDKLSRSIKNPTIKE